MNKEDRKWKQTKIRIFFVLLVIFALFFSAIATIVHFACHEQGLPTWAWVLIVIGVIALFTSSYITLLILNKKRDGK